MQKQYKSIKITIYKENMHAYIHKNILGTQEHNHRHYIPPDDFLTHGFHSPPL